MSRTLLFLLVFSCIFSRLLHSQGDSLFVDYTENLGFFFVNDNTDQNDSLITVFQELKTATEKVICPLQLISLKQASQNHLPLFYRVKKGETIFRIARIYSGQHEEDILAINNKDSVDLQIGELLLVGWIPREELTCGPEEDSNAEQAGSIPQLVDTFYLEPTEQLVTTKGIALWEKSDSTTTDMLVLHPFARVNSEIILFNPMMGRSVRATVISHLPENSYPNNISVVISRPVAYALGALDRQFLVEMTYKE